MVDNFCLAFGFKNFLRLVVSFYITIRIRFWQIFNVVFISFYRFGRALLVSRVVSVSQAWADQSHMREQWLGRFWMKKRMLIASALCLWTGLLYEMGSVSIQMHYRTPENPLCYIGLLVFLLQNLVSEWRPFVLAFLLL